MNSGYKWGGRFFALEAPTPLHGYLGHRDSKPWDPTGLLVWLNEKLQLQVLLLTFIKHLLCPQHWAKPLISISSFHPHNHLWPCLERKDSRMVKTWALDQIPGLPFTTGGNITSLNPSSSAIKWGWQWTNLTHLFTAQNVFRHAQHLEQWFSNFLTALLNKKCTLHQDPVTQTCMCVCMSVCHVCIEPKCVSQSNAYPHCYETSFFPSCSILFSNGASHNQLNQFQNPLFGKY